MKVIIAGGRDFNEPWRIGDALHGNFYLGDGQDDLEIVSGGARGADRFGERWAEAHDIPVRVFPADWETHGKSAGYIRNEEMAQYADALVAFWDGQSKGTKHMIDLALKHGLEVHVYRY